MHWSQTESSKSGPSITYLVRWAAPLYLLVLPSEIDSETARARARFAPTTGTAFQPIARSTHYGHLTSSICLGHCHRWVVPTVQGASATAIAVSCGAVQRGLPRQCCIEVLSRARTRAAQILGLYSVPSVTEIAEPEDSAAVAAVLLTKRL